MKILGIETSCDETAASVVENGNLVLSSVVASSMNIHKKYGGIVPEEAAREQLRAIAPVISEALFSVELSWKDIDVIAVTVGPGLLGSLLIGVETSRTISYIMKKPIIPINHLHGHIYACWLKESIKAKIKLPELPAVVLLVSGGHTELVLMEDHGKYKFLGGTRDDAAGEAFDKSARLLGLTYPGGPEISRMAKLHSGKSTMSLPRPIINDNLYDFSFSGLKTAVLREVQRRKFLDNQFKIDLAYELQEAITDVLVIKTLKAINDFSPKSVLVVGGVSANECLRKKMEREVNERFSNIDLFIPPVKYCTDNGAYIASCAFYNQRVKPWQEISANPGLEF